MYVAGQLKKKTNTQFIFKNVLFKTVRFVQRSFGHHVLGSHVPLTYVISFDHASQCCSSWDAFRKNKTVSHQVNYIIYASEAMRE